MSAIHEILAHHGATSISSRSSSVSRARPAAPTIKCLRCELWRCVCPPSMKLPIPTQLAGDYPTLPHPNASAFGTAPSHICQSFRQSAKGPSVRAFDSAVEWLEKNSETGRPLILDSGCGTGLSTRNLARAYPDAAVIGVDRSAARLGKSRTFELPDNALLVQSELACFWRLMLQAEASGDDHLLTASNVRKHYVLYPNPYPKPTRLNLRWHGHPALPALLAIGDEIELRSNWRTYLEEFGIAASLIASHAADDTPLREWAIPGVWSSHATRRAHSRRLAAGIEPLQLESTDDAITPFESKYNDVGEALYRLVLPSAASGGDGGGGGGGGVVVGASRSGGGRIIMQASASSDGDEAKGSSLPPPSSALEELDKMLEVLEEEAAEGKVAKARVKELEGELAAVKGRLEEAVEATGGGGNPAGTTSSGLEERCEALEEKCEDLREELDAMKMLYTSDVSALQEEVEELTKAAGGGGEGEGSGGDVEKELAEMKGELEKATARADRAGGLG